MSALLAEVFAEIRAAPLHFVAEVLQSLLVIGLVAWFGRRALGRRLHARAERIASELRGADEAEAEAVRLRAAAAGLVDAARAAAPDIVQQARDDVERHRAGFDAGVDAEAAALVEVARRTIAEERVRLEQAGADRLLAQATELASRYLEEALNEEERREVTHRAVRGLLDALNPSTEGTTGEAGAAAPERGSPTPPPTAPSPALAPARRGEPAGRAG